MAQQAQADIILTHTADMLDEIVSMVIKAFPGWYQFVKVIIINNVASPKSEWNMDLKKDWRQWECQD